MGIPGTESAENPRGVMVEVYWEQDDSGGLCMSGHSSETPIPSSVRLPETSAANTRRGFLRRAGPVHGIVLDPNQLTAAYPPSRVVLLR